MTQTTLWQHHQQHPAFAELCNALYEREIMQLAKSDHAGAIAGRLKSLPYYIKRTADSMAHAQTPLLLDSQNASWTAKQAAKYPLAGQEPEAVSQWYLKAKLMPGLVIPIALDNHIVLDCIDRVDSESNRFRSNVFGWHYLLNNTTEAKPIFLKTPRLLKPNKAVMVAGCAGHAWREKQKTRPIILSLRELLLSCQINWNNFKKPAKSN